MADSLIERLRKARQTEVTVGKFTFTVRRPTDAEAFGILEKHADWLEDEIPRRFVVDWSGVTEADIEPGGSSDPVPYSPDIAAEWFGDSPDLWAPITNAVYACYRKYNEARNSAPKN